MCAMCTVSHIFSLCFSWFLCYVVVLLLDIAMCGGCSLIIIFFFTVVAFALLNCFSFFISYGFSFSLCIHRRPEDRQICFCRFVSRNCRILLFVSIFLFCIVVSFYLKKKRGAYNSSVQGPRQNY